MALEGITPTDPSTSPIGDAIKQGTGNQNLDKNQFLKILLEQLQTQNPMDPMKNKDFVGQMAQLTSIEQISQMSDSFSKIEQKIDSQRFLSLLGKNVSVAKNDGSTVEGEVERVKMLENSTSMIINGNSVASEEISQIGLVDSDSSSSSS